MHLFRRVGWCAGCVRALVAVVFWARTLPAPLPHAAVVAAAVAAVLVLGPRVGAGRQAESDCVGGGALHLDRGRVRCPIPGICSPTPGMTFVAQFRASGEVVYSPGLICLPRLGGTGPRLTFESPPPKKKRSKQ